jgi:ribosomal protein L11 methyltransferase
VFEDLGRRQRNVGKNICTLAHSEAHPLQQVVGLESPMTMGSLVVVAVAAYAAAAATAELADRGALDIQPRNVGGGRSLVYGRLIDEEAARQVVAELRQRGWSAAQRPTDDDPFIIAWRNRTQPISVDDGRLLVALPWAEIDRDAAPVLEIDPGAAFGGGAHPTTQLLLEALATRLQGGETVLDVGCGSGVLALAAVRMGAASAVGIDVDPAAVAATRANAERNGLAPQVTAQATPLEELPGTFDVVLANIGQDVLIALAPEIERHLAPGGWLGLSGISPAQVSRVGVAFDATRIVATPQLDDWSAIVGVRC